MAIILKARIFSTYTFKAVLRRPTVIKAYLRHGVPGTGGEDKNYVAEFTNTDQVQVIHNLDKYPAVSIVDSAGEQVEGDVEHVDRNNVLINLSATMSGMVVCN